MSVTPADHEVTAPAGPPWRSRLVAAAGLAWPAIALYAATRVLTLVVLGIWSRRTKETLGGVLGDFDGKHYILIADHGYGVAPDGKELNFFPGYPMLIRGLGWISPLNSLHNALLLAFLASLVAAWGIFAVGNHLFDRRTGIVLAGLWGVVPHAMVESMAYTEGLFTTFAAWALYALLRRSWVAAGVLTALGGLIRPSGPALIAVVGIAALIAIFRRQDGWRPCVAAALAPLGWLGYMIFTAVKLGNPTGWYSIQPTLWNSSWDFGASTVRAFVKSLTGPTPLAYTGVTLVLAAALLLIAVNAIDRQPWPLLLFSIVLLIMGAGASNYYYAKARLLLPAFMLLIPIARALARTQTAKAVLIFGFLAAVSVSYGGYLAFTWHLSP